MVGDQVDIHRVASRKATAAVYYLVRRFRPIDQDTEDSGGDLQEGYLVGLVCRAHVSTMRLEPVACNSTFGSIPEISRVPNF